MKAMLLIGLVVPPAVWTLNVQLGQMLPPVDCGSDTALAAVFSLVWVVAAAAATLVSGRVGLFQVSRPHRFFFGLSVMAGAVFLFALILQGAASLLIDACAR